MRLVESRATLTISYFFLGLFAFIALFPIALLVLNSLKPAAQIVQDPLGLPNPVRWENFSHAWAHAKFSKTFPMWTRSSLRWAAAAFFPASRRRRAS